MQIKVIDFGGKLPLRAHYNDAGADIFANEEVVLYPGMTRAVKTGIGIKVPDGYMGVVYCKSGMSSKWGITAANAPIDSGYRGEIHAILTNNAPKGTDDIYHIKPGDKIGQLVILPIQIPLFTFDLNQKTRGDQGFGSTGK